MYEFISKSPWWCISVYCNKNITFELYREGTAVSVLVEVSSRNIMYL